MKVAVLNTQAPFVRGGAEALAQALHDALVDAGHEAELISFPFSWRSPQVIIDRMLSARLWRLVDIDRVIALKFPVYYVPHDNKVLWLLHQFRQVYDLWGTPLQDLPDTAEGLAVRDAIRRADTRYLSDAQRIYTNSAITGERLLRHNGLSSTVLAPPLIGAERLRAGPYGDYVLCTGRIAAAKRQRHVVEAMSAVSEDVRLIVAGPADSPADLARLQDAIQSRHLESRVSVMAGWIDPEEQAELYANALVVVNLTLDEDSHGYVTGEAMAAARPVITCIDSGGTLELVKDEVTGLVIADASPTAIAAAINRLHDDRELTQRLGTAGRELVRPITTGWGHIVEVLTS